MSKITNFSEQPNTTLLYSEQTKNDSILTETERRGPLVWIKHITVTFNLVLNKPYFIYENTGFILKSILGKELNDRCCVVKQQNCSSCIMRNTCMYSWFFETHLDKDNLILEGRTRASHPFTHCIIAKENQKVSEVDFNIPLFGKGIEYLPFHIVDVVYNKESILICEENLRIPLAPSVWELPIEKKDVRPLEGEILIKCMTPFRYKRLGSYTDNVGIQDFLLASLLRMVTFANLYGELASHEQADLSEFLLYLDIAESIVTKESKLFWKDVPYYSGRHHNPMKWGGVIGTITCEGLWYLSELALLQIAGIFHIGKNVSFGLGKIAFSKKEQ